MRLEGRSLTLIAYDTEASLGAAGCGTNACAAVSVRDWTSVGYVAAVGAGTDAVSAVVALTDVYLTGTVVVRCVTAATILVAVVPEDSARIGNVARVDTVCSYIITGSADRWSGVNVTSTIYRALSIVIAIADNWTIVNNRTAAMTDADAVRVRPADVGAPIIMGGVATAAIIEAGRRS